MVDFHELRHLDNGDYLVFTDPVTSGVNLTGLGTFGANENMAGCGIQEINPSGAVVWSWDITKHFDPVKSCTYPDTEDLGTGKVLADPYHCNSIDVASDGNLLISARNMDSVFLIDKTSQKVLWKMGGTTASLDDAKYLTVHADPDTSFHRQHDARFLSATSLSMFDDETGVSAPARAVSYTFDVNAGTASMAFQYAGPTTSAGMGSFRTSADGSRIIGWGIIGEPGLVFTELDSSGHDALDLSFPLGDVSFRAVKVPLTAFDIDTLRKTAGKD